jgi:non-ribosomal peptide synthetase component F
MTTASNDPTQVGPESLQEVRREVQQLEERLEHLEHHAGGPPADAVGVVSDPDHPASTVALQEVLPQIKDLAQRVGGMRELAQLVATLAEAEGP